MQFNELPEKERVGIQIQRIKKFLLSKNEEHLVSDLYEITKYMEKLEGFQVAK